jgi:hypothetical protein
MTRTLKIAGIIGAAIAALAAAVFYVPEMIERRAN